jgi:hypothetical protein
MKYANGSTECELTCHCDPDGVYYNFDDHAKCGIRGWMRRAVEKIDERIQSSWNEVPRTKHTLDIYIAEDF